MSYWTDDRSLDMQQRRLDAEQARAIRFHGDGAEDPHENCGRGGDETPVGVLEDGLCPACVDEPDTSDIPEAGPEWFAKAKRKPAS